MSHVAMQEADEQGEQALWGDHVSEQEYGQAADSIN
jgi:hypothetical protein